MGTKKRWSTEEKKQIVEEWLRERAAGITQAQVAAKHGASVRALKLWCQQHARQQSPDQLCRQLQKLIDEANACLAQLGNHPMPTVADTACSSACPSRQPGAPAISSEASCPSACPSGGISPAATPPGTTPPNVYPIPAHANPATRVATTRPARSDVAKDLAADRRTRFTFDLD